MKEQGSSWNESSVNKPRFRKWVMHVMAQCKTCGWSTQDYRNGQAEAARHARRTGHEIEGEIGYAFRYEK